MVSPQGFHNKLRERMVSPQGFHNKLRERMVSPDLSPLLSTLLLGAALLLSPLLRRVEEPLLSILAYDTALYPIS
jgi:hypothetical protein